MKILVSRDEDLSMVTTYESSFIPNRGDVVIVSGDSDNKIYGLVVRRIYEQENDAVRIYIKKVDI